MLRLPRNLHLTLRQCCACHAIQPLGKLDLAKVLRLRQSAAPAMQFNPWGNLTLRKCCACHEICTSPCKSTAPATEIKPCGIFALPCQWARAANVIREWSENGPTMVRPGAANRLAFSSPDTQIHAQGHTFGALLFSHHTHAHLFSRAYSFSCHLSQGELAFN